MVNTVYETPPYFIKQINRTPQYPRKRTHCMHRLQARSVEGFQSGTTYTAICVVQQFGVL